MGQLTEVLAGKLSRPFKAFTGNKHVHTACVGARGGGGQKDTAVVRAREPPGAEHDMRSSRGGNLPQCGAVKDRRGCCPSSAKMHNAGCFAYFAANVLHSTPRLARRARNICRCTNHPRSRREATAKLLYQRVSFSLGY